MNYKALYRTYRPANFIEVEGQEHIVKTLTNLIKLKKISHAYLFSGPRGTGKTSVAKIFANVINCGHNVKIEVACSLCIMTINNSVDIIEIDAASNNGINEIRELREKVKFVPTKFKYKVYIIDEVHMLTKGAFNALLKTLEEPPKHIVFILATTDSDKLPLTILSRVQRYNFKRISKPVIQKQIKFVFEKENINYELGVIEMIATLSSGSLRDALSIADQINAYSNSNIKLEHINDIFGLTSKENQVLLLNHCSGNFIGLSLKLFDKLVNQGIDIRRLINSLINLLKDYLLYSKTNDESIIEESDIEILNTIKMEEKFIYEIIDILIILLNEIKYSDIPQQLCQIAIIKICSISKKENTVILNKIKEKNFVKVEEVTINDKDIKINEITDNFVIKENDQIENSNFDERNFDQEIFNSQIINEEINEEQLTKDITDILTLSNESNIDIDQIEDSILRQAEVNNIIYDTNEFLKKDEDSFDDNLKTKLFNTFAEQNENLSFNNDETKKNKNIFLTQPEIINLFLLGDKNEIVESKTKLKEGLLSIENKFSEIISYLENCKIITSSRNFILVASEDKVSIDFLTLNTKESLVKEFLFYTFGIDKYFYAITKSDFLNSAELFKELKLKDQLPEPIELPPLERRVEKNSELESFEAEKKGLNIFGNIFNKRK